MAVIAMSTKTNKICVHRGVSWGVGTGHPHKSSVVKPGCVVTVTGCTLYSGGCTVPVSADDMTWGVVGETLDKDLDETFDTDEDFEVFERGSESVCWGWAKPSAGIIRRGTPLISDVSGDVGHVTPGETLNEYVGIAAEDSADDTDARPIKIHLV